MTTTATQPESRQWKNWWPFLLVAAAALGVFANSFGNEFVYDDWVAIVNNPYIRSWSQIWQLINPVSEYYRTYTLLSYRPLQDVFFLITYKTLGLNAGSHHTFNVLLHALNALLATMIIRRLTSDDLLALIGGLAFAVHPVHMQAVQVSGLRADLLMTPFFIAALWCYLRLRERPDDSPYFWVALAAGSYFLSCTAKEMGATVPLVALFLDLRRTELKSVLSRDGLLPYLGYTLAAAVYAFLRFGLFTNIHQGDALLGGSLFTALLTTGKIFVSYLGHLLLPLYTKPRYVVTPSYGIDAASAGAWALILALGALAWYARRRQPTLTLGLVWLAITLIPVANLVPIRNPMADRYLYLPSIGFCAIVGWAVVEGGRTAKELWGAVPERAPYAVGACLLVAWSALTWKQSTLWHDEISLWSEVLRQEPDNQEVRMSLGVALGRQGKYEEAEKLFVAALRVSPRVAEAYYSLGVVYSMEGKEEQAAELFRKTLKLDPSHKEAASRLAALRAASAGSPEAIEQARADLLRDPSSPQGHYHLGLLYQRQGMLDKAEASYREAVRLSPKFVKALNNLGIVLAREGDFSGAEDVFQKAVAADPDYARSHFNLANLYLRKREPAKALPHLEAVIRLEPDHPQIDKIRTLVDQLKRGG